MLGCTVYGRPGMTKHDVRQAGTEPICTTRAGTSLLRLPSHSPTKLRPDTVRLLYGLLIYFLTTNYNTAIGITVNLSYLMHASGQNTVYGFWEGFHTFLEHYAQYTAMELWHLMGTFPATGLLLVEPRLTRND